MQSSSSLPSIFDRLKDAIRNNENEIKAVSVGTSATLLLGHPIDTWAARVKVHSKPFYNFKLPFTQNVTHLNQTLFSDAVNKGAFDKISSLYQGIRPAIVNRSIQLGSMVAQRKVEKSLRESEKLTPKEANIATSLGLGALTAVIAAPFNQYKVTQQLKTPWVNPYASLTPTVLRNTAWFLTKSKVAAFLENFFLKNEIFGLKNQTESNETQKDVADFFGSSFGSLFSFPLDRLKNLIQGGKVQKGVIRGIRHIIEKEGIKALGRGSPQEILLQCVKYSIFYTTKNVFSKYEEEKIMHRKI